jgi:DNA polymerase III delta prime subunit
VRRLNTTPQPLTPPHPPNKNCRKGQTGFAPGACPRAEAYLAAHVVGQDLAVRQLSDAVCAHLAKPRPGRPLVVSAHGPPGVGKTLTHQLLARALYSSAPSDALECPGRGCPGYKVMYGMDYLASEAEGRLAALRRELLDHVRSHPEALIVVEEYDKLDCNARALWRQLLRHPERANVTWDRCVSLV